jgi:hypothetical protein
MIRISLQSKVDNDLLACDMQPAYEVKFCFSLVFNIWFLEFSKLCYGKLNMLFLEVMITYRAPVNCIA